MTRKIPALGEVHPPYAVLQEKIATLQKRSGQLAAERSRLILSRQAEIEASERTRVDRVKDLDFAPMAANPIGDRLSEIAETLDAIKEAQHQLQNDQAEASGAMAGLSTGNPLFAVLGAVVGGVAGKLCTRFLPALQ